MLNKYLAMRPQTDKQMSTLWVLLPFSNLVLGLVMAVIGTVRVLDALATFFANILTFPPGKTPDTTITPGLGIFGSSTLFGYLWIWSIVLSVLSAYLVYELVSRRNKHFMRQRGLVSYLLARLKPEVSGRGSDVEIPFALLERKNRDAAIEEPERSAIILAILVFIPLVNIFAWLYTFYYLTKDFHDHERGENTMVEDLARMFERLGAPLTIHRIDPIPERSLTLYILLTILTFGIFGIYWLYVVINDPNKHFRYHVDFENQLASRLPTIRKV